MATTFTDLKFAHEHGVEDKLWIVHGLINTEYRKAIQRLKGSGHTALLRNVEKQYSKHLKTAQYFYKGFIERLSARYQLRELQRVAHCMKSESMKLNEVIDAHEASLNLEVTVSCQRTLIHLGDLARYRAKLGRQKSYGIEMALTYYALAHDLLPDSGDAHHQMGVVLGDEKNDFDIIYHFYRAWSVKCPHPNVSKNLTWEFRSLLAPSSQSTGSGALDPQQVFQTWFVRLHARFFKGETFSQQDELEQEVLHRLELLLKAPQSSLFLLKTVLINISAYDVALKKVRGKCLDACWPFFFLP